MRHFYLPMVLLLSLMSGVTHAATRFENCMHSRGEAQIRACTGIINSKRYTARDKANAYRERGRAYIGKGLFEQALSDYTNSIRLRPDSWAYLGRAIVYERQGKFDLAIADATHAIQLDPTSGSYNQRAWVFYRMRDLRSALPDANQALRLDPKNKEAYDTRGWIFYEQGELERALQDFERALNLGNSEAVTNLGRALILLKRGDLDGAFRDLDEALRKDPKLGRAYYARGQAYERKALPKLAADDYRKALATEPLPNDPYDSEARSAARSAIARLQKGPSPGAVPSPVTVPSPSPVQAAAKPQVPSPGVAAPGRRVALVIGNSAYQHTPALDNPVNDATDMAAALRRFGFEVIEGYNLGKAPFDGKLREFAMALAGANAGVFFYAGHGLHVAGRNYLMPVDARFSTASALDFETVQLDFIQRIMEREAKTNILFLDACRNNPLVRNLARALGTRSAEIGSRGLARVESGAGTLISFSTQPGNVALDGSGRNSPFTGALVKHLTTSSDDIGAILIGVRNDVMKATHDKQVPWEHSALRKRFWFKHAPATTSLSKQ